MPADLESLCEQILEELVTVLQRIRRSILSLTNIQGCAISDRHLCRLGKIRTSAETVLAALSNASLTRDPLNYRIRTWLISGQLPSCLDKLREVDETLRSADQTCPALPPAGPFRAPNEKLSAAMGLLDEHNSLFCFLLNPEAWNYESTANNRRHDTQGTQTRNVDERICGSETDYFTASEFYDTASETEHSVNGCSPNINQKLTRKNRNFVQSKLDEILRWLAPLNCMERHNHTLHLRQVGTCTWLPETDAYKRWRTSGTRFLWVNGKAGCGKSVLAASMIEDLKMTLRREEVVAFFYCDFRDKRSTSPTEMMRSLLSQLLSHLCHLEIDPRDLPDKILAQKSEGILSLDDLNRICDFILHVARCFSYDPIIVIDALDECTNTAALLRALVILKQGDVRLFVTSRPNEVVANQFRGLGSICLDSMVKEIAGDIGLHIRQEVDSHEQLRSAGMKEEIFAKLTEKAEGRFRWVECQLNTLKRCGSRQQLRQALDNLPNELEATYERILDEIDERNSEGKLARRALAWLVVALEPLRLAQIVQGLLVDHEIDCQKLPVGRSLIHALSSLVTHYEGTDILTFSHFSVKEYLLGHKAPPMYHIIPPDAHAEVARMCMRNISAVLKQTLFRGKFRPLQSSSVLSYILSSGFNHLAYVDPGPNTEVVLEALHSLGFDVHHHPSHWELLCEIREEHFRWPYPTWPSSRHNFIFYVLIAYCTPELLRSFLTVNGHVLKPRVKTNSLIYAAELRKQEHAMILLACDADLNLDGHGLVVDDTRHALPLDIAIDLGEDELVGELLRRGFKVTSELLSAAICMPWCSTRVLVKLMQTNEFLVWARNIGDEKLYRGVFSSARPNSGDNRRSDEDHVMLAGILCQVGLDLSANSPFGAELTTRAIYAAHTSMLEFLLPRDQPPPSRYLLAASTGQTSEAVSVVRFLLLKGVNVHAVSAKRRDNALHFAIMCPWEPRSLELSKLLIDAGCTPHACNSEGKTVMEAAIGREYTSVVDLLLSFRVSFPHDILPVALRKLHSSLTMVEYLIQKGANVLSTTTDGDTVLHLAIMEYPESTSSCLLKSLIDAGCNPVTPNSEGKTAFDIAIRREYVSVVKLLLYYKVPCPRDILLTALRKRWSPQVFKTMIQYGADVHAITPIGNTVLHLAIIDYCEPLCLELIKIFIEAGCNPITRNFEGQTIFEVAIKREYTLVVDALLSYHVPFPSDILPVGLRKLRSNPQIVEYLIQKGSSVHSTTSDGNTLLHLAVAGYAEPKCLDLVKMFIKAGCNLTAPNFEGKTALQAAVERGYSSVEFLLLSNTLSPPCMLPIVLRKRWTPEKVKSLIRSISDNIQANSTSPSEDSILHLAIKEYSEYPSLELVIILVDAGFSLMAQDLDGKTVLEAAMNRGYVLVTQYILSCNVARPPTFVILSEALRQQCDPKIIRFLVRKYPDDLIALSGSQSDTLLSLVHESYTGLTRHWVIGMLNTARKPTRTYPRCRRI